MKRIRGKKQIGKSAMFAALMGALTLANTVSAFEPIPDFSTKVVPANITTEACEAYLGKCNELIANYDECELQENLEKNYNPDPNALPEYISAGGYMKGLSVVQLMDFDGDGEDDLLTICQQGEVSASTSYSEPAPQPSNYTLSVWSYKDGTVKELLNVDHVGNYDDDPHPDDGLFISVYEDLTGKKVIQILVDCARREEVADWEQTETEEVIAEYLTGEDIEFSSPDTHSIGGYQYENYYYENGTFIKDVYIFDKGSMSKNGEYISEEEWNQQMNAYIAIDYVAVLSESALYPYYCDYACSEKSEYQSYYYSKRTKEYYGVNLTKEQTDLVLESLKENEPVRMPSAAGELITAYVPLMDETMRQQHVDNTDSFRFGYALQDVDGDGTEEFIMVNQSFEAARFYVAYYIKNGQAEYYGGFGGAHSAVAFSDDGKTALLDGSWGYANVMEVRFENGQITQEEVFDGMDSDVEYGEYIRKYPNTMDAYVIASPLLLYLHAL